MMMRIKIILQLICIISQNWHRLFLLTGFVPKPKKYINRITIAFRIQIYEASAVLKLFCNSSVLMDTCAD